MYNRDIILDCIDIRDKKKFNRIYINDKNFLKKIDKKKIQLIFCTFNEFVKIHKELKNIKSVFIINNQNIKFLEKIKYMIKILISFKLKKITFVILKKNYFYINTLFPFYKKTLESDHNFFLIKIIFYLKNFFYFFNNNYLIIYR